MPRFHQEVWFSLVRHSSRVFFFLIPSSKVCFVSFVCCCSSSVDFIRDTALHWWYCHQWKRTPVMGWLFPSVLYRTEPDRTARWRRGLGKANLPAIFLISVCVSPCCPSHFQAAGSSWSQAQGVSTRGGWLAVHSSASPPVRKQQLGRPRALIDISPSREHICSSSLRSIGADLGTLSQKNPTTSSRVNLHNEHDGRRKGQIVPL